MDSIPSPILTDVLEVISTANESMDFQLVRQKALDALFRTISAEGAIFFLPDGSGRFTSIKLKHLEREYSEYYRDYFHQFDPLGLSSGRLVLGKTSSREKIFSYDSYVSTEYYNDFLRPQGIHHKLIVNLIAEKELHGRIVLTRPRPGNSFTKNEMLTVKTVSPYLAHALAHNNLRRKIRLKGTVLDYIEKQSSVGMILLDVNLQIIYCNKKADEAIRELVLSGSVLERNNQLPPQVLNDCKGIKTKLKDCPVGGTTFPKQSFIKGPNHTNFSITSRVLEQTQDWDGSLLFMVCIEKQMSAEERSRGKISPQHLMDEFSLSKRETDVVELVFLGLKNAEVARKLFVSEVTVKKHLQNVYEKVGVSSRTALINRIMTS